MFNTYSTVQYVAGENAKLNFDNVKQYLCFKHSELGAIMAWRRAGCCSFGCAGHTSAAIDRSIASRTPAVLPRGSQVEKFGARTRSRSSRLPTRGCSTRGEQHPPTRLSGSRVNGYNNSVFNYLRDLLNKAMLWKLNFTEQHMKF